MTNKKKYECAKKNSYTWHFLRNLKLSSGLKDTTMSESRTQTTSYHHNNQICTTNDIIIRFQI